MKKFAIDLVVIKARNIAQRRVECQRGKDGPRPDAGNVVFAQSQRVQGRVGFQHFRQLDTSLVADAVPTQESLFQFATSVIGTNSLSNGLDAFIVDEISFQVDQFDGRIRRKEGPVIGVPNFVVSEIQHFDKTIGIVAECVKRRGRAAATDLILRHVQLFQMRSIEEK